jgi:hypothetical protein
MCDCIDLLGKPYRLGAQGNDPDGALDCISLVYVVLKRLQIETPPFDKSWYVKPYRAVLRDLLSWGNRIAQGSYDGDVVLAPQDRWAFGVVWDQGILHIHPLTQKVAWCPIAAMPTAHFFRGKKKSSTSLA